MNNASKRLEGRQKRHKRLRKKVYGTGDQPRLSVFRSSLHIYVQAIDDIGGNTLASSSSLEIKKSLNKIIGIPIILKVKRGYVGGLGNYYSLVDTDNQQWRLVEYSDRIPNDILINAYGKNKAIQKTENGWKLVNKSKWDMIADSSKIKLCSPSLKKIIESIIKKAGKNSTSPQINENNNPGSRDISLA